MDCRVVVEAAVPVYDVGTADEAVRIAISKTGGMLNPDLSYVEIDVGTRTSPSGEALEPAFIVADEALVALELEMTVFNVEREEHAARIARKEIGQRMENVPLDVLDVSVLGEEGTGDGSDPEDADGSPSSETTAAEGDGAADNGDGNSNGNGDGDDRPGVPGDGEKGPNTSARRSSDTEGGDDDGSDGPNGDDGPEDERTDVLPEFEELIDE
jgi:uncharacterized protein (UPF0212 family)